ncbi:MAG: hypothetical protein JWN51_2712, partial [Phycisphaerales bacterium]|nr:hypothetical protein [Phycisphaerales bacterium]
MNIQQQHAHFITRRHFFRRCNAGLGAMALASLMGKTGLGAQVGGVPSQNPLTPRPSMFAPKAKRVIYLHMSGAPPQNDLFDYKPKLNELNGTPCPKEIFQGERFAFIKGTPKLLGSPYKFARHGQSGTWVSELLPHTAGVID